MENLNYCLKSSRYELKKYYIKMEEVNGEEQDRKLWL